MTEAPDLVAIKSFGDLVIALTAIARRDAARPAPRLLLGEHLRPLFAALEATLPLPMIAVLRHGQSGVPSAYDARKNGLRAAASSLMALRREIRLTQANRLLFDRLGWRERFIAAGRPVQGLPGADNIYLAYEKVLGGHGQGSAGPPASSILGIFPGSRLARKNLPLQVIEAARRAAMAQGVLPHLYLLEGERPDLEQAAVASTILPRSFETMINAVVQCGAVVSADSMPAHLAEALGVPVYVASPMPNPYWLPRSAFVARRWCVFGDPIEHKLTPFLSEIRR